MLARTELKPAFSFIPDQSQRCINHQPTFYINASLTSAPAEFVQNLDLDRGTGTAERVIAPKCLRQSSIMSATQAPHTLPQQRRRLAQIETKQLRLIRKGLNSNNMMREDPMVHTLEAQKEAHVVLDAETRKCSLELQPWRGVLAGGTPTEHQVAKDGTPKNP